MANNLETLSALAAKQTRQLDLGDFADAERGKILDVWVNPPAIVEIVRAVRDAEQDYAHARRVVSILFDLPLDAVEKIDDLLVSWLFARGLDLYQQYHEELKKR